MSADNGVYILVTKTRFKKESDKSYYRSYYQNKPIPVYRVATAQAIDNLDYYKEHQPHNVGAYMQFIWGNSKEFYSKEEAREEARKIFDKEMEEIGICEYGICEVDMSNFEFYGD